MGSNSTPYSSKWILCVCIIIFKDNYHYAWGTVLDKSDYYPSPQHFQTPCFQCKFVNLDMDKDFMFDLACFAVFCCIAHIILLQWNGSCMTMLWNVIFHKCNLWVKNFKILQKMELVLISTMLTCIYSSKTVGQCT